MGISFIDPRYLLLLLLVPLLWVVALSSGRLRGRRRWWSLGLRTLMIAALILSLAGTQLLQPVQELTTVFLLDSSDSVSPGQRAQGEAFIEQALGTMQGGDKAAVVVFGESPLVERAPSDEQRLGRIQSVPTASRTNIEEALNLALALFPADTQKRIVLLSDGGENQGRALEALRLAESRNVPIEVVLLGEASGSAEAAVVNLRTVSRAREGQTIDLVATVESNVAQEGTLRFLGDNVVLDERQVQVPQGTTTFTATIEVGEQGFHRYTAELLPAQDTRPQNNEAGSLVQVQGPPKVLIVAGEAADGEVIAQALEASDLTPVLVGPSGLPTDLPGLAEYESIIIANVPSRAIPNDVQLLLQSYVRDLGRGLVMIGGTQSYGVGAYTNTPIAEALPVDMDVRNRQQRPDIAIVFVIDKSGSMGACHCEGGDDQRIGGVAKIDIAKEAVAQASVVLGKEDQIGVVAFDESAHWLLDTQQLPDQETINEALASANANGNTNIAAGLIAAEEALLASDAKIKHVILLTDGWSNGGDQLGTAQRMRDEGITLSIVAAGSGSAGDLKTLSDAGGGRFYNARSMVDVPQIFLEETIQAVGTYIVEQEFTPAYVERSPILSGLEEGVPQLFGYNGTAEKDAARVLLVGPDGAPVLAQWQYGLGRSVAWTSDMKGKWGRDWIRWSEFPTFVGQLVGWTLPIVGSETVNVQSTPLGGDIEVQVTAEDEQGNALSGLRVEAVLVGSDVRQPLALDEVGPGRYVGRAPSPPSGVYLIQVSGVDAEGTPIFVQSSGLLVPYSPEYRQGQSNLALLEALAQRSSGRVLTLPPQAFEHNLEAVSRALPISFPLLLLALLLLPFDIAVRRLSLRWRDVRGWREGRAAQREVAAQPSPVLEGLQQAKSRAGKRRATTDVAQTAVENRAAPPPIDTTPAPTAARQERPGQQVTQPLPSQSGTPAAPDPEELTDPLARLKAAKQRARRQ